MYTSSRCWDRIEPDAAKQMDESRLDETAESMHILHTKAHKSRSHLKEEYVAVYPDFVFIDKLPQRAYLSSLCRYASARTDHKSKNVFNPFPGEFLPAFPVPDTYVMRHN